MSKKKVSAPIPHNEWIENIVNISLTTWNEIPDIGLYMDQVLVLMDKYIGSILASEDKESFLTPSMINNYVKSGIMPAPNGKKYSREHIVYLIMICLMKQSLSIASIQAIINIELGKASINELYIKFCKYFEEYVKCIVDNKDITLSSSSDDDNILRLGIISNICRLVSDNNLKMVKPIPSKTSKKKIKDAK